MNTILEDKCVGAFLAAAIGDALGWPNESRANNVSKKASQVGFFEKWTRKSGGRYFQYREEIDVGEYSDDTQMILAVARSVMYGDKWNSWFTKHELPFWIEYERGGGNATKTAAKKWAKGNNLWDGKDQIFITDYFNAGGNGVAMRILPHVVVGINGTLDYLMREVIRNGMYTHGHPRALLGATCYAYALWYTAQKSDSLAYGELADALLNGREIWGKFHSIDRNWDNIANRFSKQEFFQLWTETVDAMVRNIILMKQSLQNGLLDDGDFLNKLGCFGRFSGAGDIAALAATYLASKYAANPKQGIIEAAFLKGADTDTIASMVGGLLGMIQGSKWMPIEWQIVQDYGYIASIPIKLLNLKSENYLVESATNIANDDEWVSPIGVMKFVRSPIIINEKRFTVTIQKSIAPWGQTVYTKNIKKKENVKETPIESKSSTLQHRFQQSSFFDSRVLSLNASDVDCLVELTNIHKKLSAKKLLEIITNWLNGDHNFNNIAENIGLSKSVVVDVYNCLNSCGKKN